MNIIDLLEEYLLDIEIKGYSPHTIRSTSETVRQFVQVAQCDEIEQITTLTIKKYIQALQVNLKASTINTRLKHLRSIFKYAVSEELLKMSPMERIRLLKEEKTMIMTYSIQDIEKILNYYKGRTFNEVRNKTCIMMYCETGIRSTELRTIKVGDMHEGSIRIIGKGNKVRYVPISLPLKRQLLKYERARKVFLKGIEVDWYFIGRTRKQMHHTIPLAIVNNMKIDLSVKPTIHHFRRWYAQQMLKSVDLYTLSRLMGHSSVQVTETYIRGLQDSEILSKGMDSPLSNM